MKCRSNSVIFIKESKVVKIFTNLSNTPPPLFPNTVVPICNSFLPSLHWKQREPLASLHIIYWVIIVSIKSCVEGVGLGQATLCVSRGAHSPTWEHAHTCATIAHVCYEDITYAEKVEWRGLAENPRRGGKGPHFAILLNRASKYNPLCHLKKNVLLYNHFNLCTVASLYSKWNITKPKIIFVRL